MFNRSYNLEEFSTDKKLIYKCFAKSNIIGLISTHIGSIGSMLSIEEIYFFLQFLQNSSDTNLLLNNRIFNFSMDLPLFYQFNSKFNGIEQSDLLLLIGTNPRNEASLLNLKIRKHFFNKEVFVGFLGSFSELTYPVQHLGTSTKVLLQLCEGRHIFCKKLRAAKKPLLIVSSNCGFRIDAQNFQNLIKFLSKKMVLNLKHFLGLNYLHPNLSQNHICELGIALDADDFLYALNLDKTYLQNSVGVSY